MLIILVLDCAAPAPLLADQGFDFVMDASGVKVKATERFGQAASTQLADSVMESVWKAQQLHTYAKTQQLHTYAKAAETLIVTLGGIVGVAI